MSRSKLRPDLDDKPQFLAVRDALLPKRALNAKELAEKTGLTVPQVNSALYQLRKMGWAHTEKIEGSSELMHTLQTEGAAQGQKGLTVIKGRGKKRGASKTVVEPLQQRIDQAIDGVVDAVANLQNVMTEARMVLTAADNLRASLFAVQ